MTFRVIFAVAFFLASAAEAARIRDLSLPPEESLRQPNIIHAPALPESQPMQGEAAARPEERYGKTGGRFMDGYCDPSIQPVVQNANVMHACLQQARTDACQHFRRLPADAQAALDRVIACDYAGGDGGAPPGDCADAGRRQLQLVKKYWDDPDTSHALVFLPDKVNNPAAGCAGR